MTNSESDEWEYEYSSTETETFYIPLDFSNVPSAEIPPAVIGRPGHPTLLKSRLRALNAQRGLPIEIPTIRVEGEPAPTMGELQIVGLHTTEPLVMYNNQLLSCEWNATLGTDMFFAKPVADADAASAPLRSLPEVDLIAASSAKLVARNATLRPKDEVIDDVGDAEKSDMFVNVTADAITGEKRKAPTSFLDKLNEARAKRGKKRRLVVSQTAQGSRLVLEKGRSGWRGGRGGRGGRAGRGGRGGRGGKSQPNGNVAMGGT